jgi:AraC-like DNA-binding protein
VAAVAAQLGVSRGHLNRIFKEVRGYGPGHARLLLQIDVAKGLLTEGCSLQQTASLSGFNSTTGFREAFTRVVGVSPKRWQREHR